jgi:formate hydrogenlyase subunit 6/NADH:ubiquinone oxidoreductase subunit I
MGYVREIYDGLKTFMVGMKVTAAYLKDANRKATAGQVTTTIPYDGTMTLARDVKLSPRFRGHLHNDIERCIVCKACAKACPIDCFWIDGEKNEAGKLRPSRFDIDLLKCMYCGLCVVACPTGCLTMTKEWWGATFNEADGTNLHGQLRNFGVGYYTPEKKQEVEKKRIEAAEAKKKAAAAAAAAKAAAAAEAKKKADAAAAAGGAPAAAAPKPAIPPAAQATPPATPPAAKAPEAGASEPKKPDA